MARIPKDVVVTSRPVRTFPNGDYLYVQLSRRDGQYDCAVKMARSGDPERSLIMARAQGKTIRDVETKCYERALARCPGFPKPPYLRRGSGASRTLVKAASA
jgi:hypothetical protein